MAVSATTTLRDHERLTGRGAMIPGDLGAELAAAIGELVAAGYLPERAAGRSAAGTWRPVRGTAVPGAAGSGVPAGRAAASYATSLPFELAGLAGQEPIAVAAQLGRVIQRAGWITSAEPTGAGYLTIGVTAAALSAVAVRTSQAGSACVRGGALSSARSPVPPRPELTAALSWRQAWHDQAAAMTARLADAASAIAAPPDRGQLTTGTPARHPAAGDDPGPRTPAAGSTMAAAVEFAGADAVRYWLARLPAARAGILDRGVFATGDPVWAATRPRGAGARDAGAPEARAPKAGAPEAGARGVGPPEAGVRRARARGARARDGRARGARAPDAGARNAGAPTAGARDAGAPEVAAPSARSPDLRAPDLRAPDLRAPGARAPEGPPYSAPPYLSRELGAVRFAAADAAATGRWAAELGLGRLEPPLAAGQLGQPAEIALLIQLSWLAERVAGAARRRQPDELPRYLERLAGAWRDCRESCPALPFGGRAAPGDAAGTSARLWLADATATALAAGLDLVGVGS